MQRIDLTNAGFSTSRLGFGLSGLMGAGSGAVRQRLLGQALDRGVTHFDTARLYGAGLAERELGRFLKGRRDRITVTTKFGLDPAPLPVAAASRLLDKAGLKRAGRRLDRAARGSRGERFSPAAARAALETSLSALRTDYIDLWLLHEVVADELGPGLWDFIEAVRREGKVRAVGVGTDFANLAALDHAWPQLTRIVQFENNVVARNVEAVEPETRDLVTHRALGPALERLSAYLQARPGLSRDWSRRVDFDLSDRQGLGAALMAYALEANRTGVVLFSTRSAKHLDANVKAAAEPALTYEQVLDFVALVREAGL